MRQVQRDWVERVDVVDPSRTSRRPFRVLLVEEKLRISSHFVHFGAEELGVFLPGSGPCVKPVFVGTEYSGAVVRGIQLRPGDRNSGISSEQGPPRRRLAMSGAGAKPVYEDTFWDLSHQHSVGH